jgi:hypothetical protein
MLRVYHVSQILFTNDLDDADPCVHIVYLLGFLSLYSNTINFHV